MVQTPAQRRANERYRAKEEQKMGTFRPPKLEREERKKTDLKKKFQKSSISRTWIYALLFVLIGGAFLEILRLFLGW